jgi:hypothetical protein
LPKRFLASNLRGLVNIVVQETAVGKIFAQRKKLGAAGKLLVCCNPKFLDS